jgi:hypothetical protein
MPLPAIMTKPLTAITIDDVMALCTEGATEGQYLDFKENLSGRGETGNTWNEGGDFSARAAAELARSVVAFANAEGGWLVLGIREDGNHPARAREITPLRACGELARRLRQSIQARIDPTPLGLDAWGIDAAAGGAGVVILRMPASPYAPHAVVTDRRLECYIRRNDECRPMTMRDIQERTLEISRGLGGLEALLDQHRATFANLLAPDDKGLPNARREFLAYRVTALPTRARFEIERVYRGNWTRAVKPDRSIEKPGGGDAHNLHSGMTSLGPFRPSLRAAISSFCHDGYRIELSISAEGGINFTHSDAAHADGIFLDWIGADVLNVLHIADAVRAAAGHADAEYALEVGIIRRHAGGPILPTFKLAPLGAHNLGLRSGEAPSPVRLPIWRVGAATEFGDVSISVMNDLCNAAGWEEISGYSLKADN